LWKTCAWARRWTWNPRGLHTENRVPIPVSERQYIAENLSRGTLEMHSTPRRAPPVEGEAQRRRSNV
jgi:hypothetical protein